MLWWLASVGVAAPLDPLAFAPLAPTLDPSDGVTVNTDAPSITIDGQTLGGVLDGQVAVFTFGSVTLDRPLSAGGNRPFAILSQSTLVVDDAILAGSGGRDGGPGGFDGGSDDFGEAGSGPGGGSVSGGRGAGGGAFGGAGGVAEDGVSGGAVYGDLLAALQGGSGGGKSDSVGCFPFWCDENGNGGGAAAPSSSAPCPRSR
ncbi:MAG: hypothetical protein R3F59_14180 [Myxococcota bacterium]